MNLFPGSMVGKMKIKQWALSTEHRADDGGWPPKAFEHEVRTGWFLHFRKLDTGQGLSREVMTRDHRQKAAHDRSQRLASTRRTSSLQVDPNAR